MEDVEAFGLRLKDIVCSRVSIRALSVLSGLVHAYCSGKSRSNASFVKSASSSLWSSSTAGCFPFDVRLDDASACPNRNRLCDELDIPLTYISVRSGAHYWTNGCVAR
jgi:hypothetical protein